MEKQKTGEEEESLGRDARMYGGGLAGKHDADEVRQREAAGRLLT